MALDIRWVASPNNSGGDFEKWFVVIHATVTRETSDGAELVAGWFADPDFDASTQYVVDNTDIIQCVRETAYAWSAGTTANKYGIHIELVAMPGQTRGEWSDDYSDAELRLAAQLTAQLCRKRGIPIRKVGPADLRAKRGGICGHDDVRDAWHETTHWDPGPNFPWDRFIRYVRAAAQEEDIMASIEDLRKVIREELAPIRAEVEEQNKRSVRQTQRIMSFLRGKRREGDDEQDPQ